MSAATKITVFSIRVKNTRIAQRTDEWFPEYGYTAVVWFPDASDFIAEALEHHPNADVDVSTMLLYQRQIDELPATRKHAPSLRELKEMDPSYMAEVKP